MIRKLIIDACGPEFARRFFLKDGEGNFWNERDQTWTGDFSEAGLWADLQEVHDKMHDLMLAQMPGELQLFTAPVVIEVKSTESVDIPALQQWLDKAVQVFMNAQHGVGPAQCMVMLRIDWQDLKKENSDVPNTKSSDGTASC